MMMMMMRVVMMMMMVMMVMISFGLGDSLIGPLQHQRGQLNMPCAR